MVEQIDYPLFSGPCEGIKNWDTAKKTSRNVAATMHDHRIGNNFGHTKKAIDIEVNIHLLGISPNKMRATGETKAMWEFKMGGHDEKKS